jgi:hypothetical protein
VHYSSFATRVSQLNFFAFLSYWCRKKRLQMHFNRYSVITQFAKLAAGEQLCRRCTHRKLQQFKTCKSLSWKNHTFWVVTLLSQMSDMSCTNLLGLFSFICSQACVYIIWFVLGLVFVTLDPVCPLRFTLIWLINHDKYVIMVTLYNVTKSDCTVYALSGAGTCSGKMLHTNNEVFSSEIKNHA